MGALLSCRAPSRPAQAGGDTLDDPNLERDASARPTPSPEAGAAPGPPREPPSGPPPGPGAEPAAEAPGLVEQLGRTISAGRRLVTTHTELAKAELGDILDEVKRVAAFVGVAIAALILVGLLLTIGLMLFVGEALFGSMGWGILHGTLLMSGIALACVLVALGVSGGQVGRSLAIAVVLGIVVGVVLGLDLTNRGWTALGDSVAGNVSSDIRPLVVAAATLTILGALIGLLLGARAGGGGGAVGGLVAGALVGLGLGALTAIATGPRVGAAIGVTVVLIVWLALMGVTVSRGGIDFEALKARFWPQQTIDTTKETIEWVREQTPLGPRS